MIPFVETQVSGALIDGTTTDEFIENRLGLTLPAMYPITDRFHLCERDVTGCDELVQVACRTFD